MVLFQCNKCNLPSKVISACLVWFPVFLQKYITNDKVSVKEPFVVYFNLSYLSREVGLSLVQRRSMHRIVYTCMITNRIRVNLGRGGGGV